MNGTVSLSSPASAADTDAALDADGVRIENAQATPPTNAPLIPVTSPEARPYLQQITHVYTDLDGTLFAPGGKLLANHTGEPSIATAEALIALKRAGIKVIIVTGRNGAQGSELLRILNLQTFIGELGCFVMEGFGANAHTSYELGELDDLILAPDLAPGELPAGVTPYQLIAQSGTVERLLAAFPNTLEPADFYPSVRTVTHAFRGFIDLNHAETVLSREPLPLTLVDNGQIHPPVHTLVGCPEIHIYHLVPRGASKSRAVAADMARRSLTPGTSLAIGDAKADVEMGAHTGLFVVMGNALHSAAVQTALGELTAQGNVALCTEGSTADGWVEFACALLASHQSNTS
jgi:hydroxymethylpyrimidine pyrophosphatase-like HAD family hydrolase